MDIGYGFIQGLNRVSKERVRYWLHDESINWKAFLWYISQYVEIVDFSNTDMQIRLVSSKQREHFYKKAKDYKEDVEEHNYKIDKTNMLWKDHYNGNTSHRVLERILVGEEE